MVRAGRPPTRSTAAATRIQQFRCKYAAIGAHGTGTLIGAPCAPCASAGKSPFVPVRVSCATVRVRACENRARPCASTSRATRKTLLSRPKRALAPTRQTAQPCSHARRWCVQLNGRTTPPWPGLRRHYRPRLPAWPERLSGWQAASRRHRTCSRSHHRRHPGPRRRTQQPARARPRCRCVVKSRVGSAKAGNRGCWRRYIAYTLASTRRAGYQRRDRRTSAAAANHQR